MGAVNESPESRGRILPFMMTKRIQRQRQEAQARFLYRITGGFVDPEPPEPEAIQMFLEGWEIF